MREGDGRTDGGYRRISSRESMQNAPFMMGSWRGSIGETIGVYDGGGLVSAIVKERQTIIGGREGGKE